MKMTAKELLKVIDEIDNNIQNLTMLKASTEWDAKDKIDDSTNVNRTFNTICQDSMEQLILLRTILKDTLATTEVCLGEQLLCMRSRIV